jgi:death on curing protein
MKNLTIDEVLFLHFSIIEEFGGSQGVRAADRLESAVISMNQEVFGQDLYPSLFDKAAVVCRGIIADHPFVDGNKRSGITASITFLMKNGITISVLPKELEDFAVQVAVEKLEVAVISAWFRSKCK